MSPGKDEGLEKLNVIHKLFLCHRKESKEKTNKSRDELSKKMEPGICLDVATGCGEHSGDGRFCVKIQSFQRRDLATWFGCVTEKEKSEVQILADC